MSNDHGSFDLTLNKLIDCYNTLILRGANPSTVYFLNQGQVFEFGEEYFGLNDHITMNLFAFGGPPLAC